MVEVEKTQTLEYVHLNINPHTAEVRFYEVSGKKTRLVKQIILKYDKIFVNYTDGKIESIHIVKDDKIHLTLRTTDRTTIENVTYHDLNER